MHAGEPGLESPVWSLDMIAAATKLEEDAVWRILCTQYLTVHLPMQGILVPWRTRGSRLRYPT